MLVFVNQPTVGLSLSLFLVTWAPTPQLNIKMVKLLVDGGLRRSYWVGRMRAFSWDERHWRVGVRGQLRACYWDSPGRLAPPRSDGICGGGVLAGEGEPVETMSTGHDQVELSVRSHRLID